MLKSSGCAMCTHALGGAPSTACDRRVWENEHFVVVPSRGSLVPGWLLVVSKEHHLCVGALPSAQRAALHDAVAIARDLVAESIGPPTLFEHGPARCGTTVGCGIDHLHVHAVPLAFSLREAVEQCSGPVRWNALASLDDLSVTHEAGRSYISIQEPGASTAQWFEPLDPPRQLVRRAIAARLGMDAEYDYAAYPREDMAVETLRRLNHSLDGVLLTAV